MAKKKKKGFQHDPEWARAKTLCRLNMEDVRMAKELGISPRSLTKNIPSKSQRWKLPVKLWIRDLYDEMLERREAKQARKAASSGAPSPAASQHSAPDENKAAGPPPEGELLVGDLMDEPAESPAPTAPAEAARSVDDVPF